jgi:hypothetical protein
LENDERKQKHTNPDLVDTNSFVVIRYGSMSVMTRKELLPLMESPHALMNIPLQLPGVGKNITPAIANYSVRQKDFLEIKYSYNMCRYI